MEILSHGAMVTQLLGPRFRFAFVKKGEHGTALFGSKNKLMSGILPEKPISRPLLRSPPHSVNVPNTECTSVSQPAAILMFVIKTFNYPGEVNL